ncbi:MAG: hypothetical protein ACREGH_03905 [Minisyncoccia bacterium]
MPPELLEYVQKQLAACYTREVLRRVLLSSGGWSDADIDAAFAALDAQASSPAPAPRPNPNPNPPKVAPSAAVTPKRRLRWPIVFAVIVAILVVAGGAAAYVALVKNAATPIEILKRAFTATSAEKSFTFSATTTDQVLEASSTPRTLANFSLAVGGSIDRHDSANPAADLSINGSFSGAMASGTLAASGTLRVIAADKKAYLNLTKAAVSYTPSGLSTDLNDELSAAMASGIAQSVENKWIEVDASSSAVAASTSPAFAADERALLSYVESASYVTLSQNAGRETFAGVPTEHLKFTLTFEQQLADILSSLIDDQSTIVSNGVESLRASSAQMAAVAAVSSADASSTAAARNALSKLVGQQASIDVWVGTKDSLIYQFAIEPLTFTNTSGTANTFSFVATYGNWDKTFSITPPGNAEPLQQFLQNTFAGLFSTSTGTSAPMMHGPGEPATSL